MSSKDKFVYETAARQAPILLGTIRSYKMSVHSMPFQMESTHSTNIIGWLWNRKCTRTRMERGTNLLEKLIVTALIGRITDAEIHSRRWFTVIPRYRWGLWRGPLNHWPIRPVVFLVGRNFWILCCHFYKKKVSSASLLVQKRTLPPGACFPGESLACTVTCAVMPQIHKISTFPLLLLLLFFFVCGQSFLCFCWMHMKRDTNPNNNLCITICLAVENRVCLRIHCEKSRKNRTQSFQNNLKFVSRLLDEAWVARLVCADTFMSCRLCRWATAQDSVLGSAELTYAHTYIHD